MAVIQHASSSAAFRSRLEHAVAETEGTTIVSSPEIFQLGSVDHIVETLAGVRPDLIILGPEPDLEVTLEVAEALDARHPHISVVIVAMPSTTVFERAMRVGARAVLAPDAETHEILQIVQRNISVAQRRRAATNPAVADSPEHRIIPVLAAKGGSGKTTVATNLACAIAQQHPGDVLIVDLDMQFGDVASAFGIEPVHSFTDIGRRGTSLDLTRLKAHLTPKQAASLYVLAAPNTPAEADDLDPQHVAQAIKLLASEFPYVVVDTAAGIDEFTLEVLDIATDLVLLASMDVPSIRAVAKEIDALRILGVDQNNWHVVLNRASEKVGITINDVEATLGLPIDVKIPAGKNVPLSVNRGHPVVLSEPKSAVSRSFAELAGRTSPQIRKTSGWTRRK